QVRKGTASLPRMETDIILRSSDQKVIVETKFTGRSTVSYRGPETLNSDHLYQLYAYMNNMSKEGLPDSSLGGVLLYPRAGAEPLDVVWRLQDRWLRALSIDLAQEWPDLKSALLTWARDPVGRL